MSSKKTAAITPTLRLEYLPLDELMRWPGNPKEHAEGAIAASVQRFGFRDPLAIDEATGRLIAGHGRLTVLERAHAAGQDAPQFVQVREDGMWLVPVTRGSRFESEAEASAYLIAHNRTTELGGWDDELLGTLLGTLDDDLRAASGFDLDAFVQELTPEPPSEFLNDLITSPQPPEQAPPTQNAEPATPPSDPEEPYLQVVYVVRKSDRDLALDAVKKARAAFGVDTAPEAFVAIMRDYLTRAATA